MLQDTGSVEIFCSVHNHHQVLVNIPELVEHLYKTESEDTLEKYRDSTADPIGNQETPSNSIETSNDTSSIDGA